MIDKKRKNIINIYLILILILSVSIVVFKKNMDNEVTINENSNNNEDLSDKDHNLEKSSSEENPSKGETVQLDVPLIRQNPELYNGCEVTCLTMLMKYKGINVDKITLAEEMKKDSTEVVKDRGGNIIKWGNPDVGFVGNITGKEGIGYGVNPGPLKPLIKKHTGKNAIDLTGKTINDIEKSIGNKNPVIAWVTADMGMPYGFFTWKDSEGNNVKGTFQTHAVLLTGYDEEDFYYNDPLNGVKQGAINKENFKNVWIAMGKKALTME